MTRLCRSAALLAVLAVVLGFQLTATPLSAPRADDSRGVTPVYGWEELRGDCGLSLNENFTKGFVASAAVYTELGRCDGYLLGALSFEYHLRKTVAPDVVDKRRPDICLPFILPVSMLSVESPSTFIARWYDIDSSPDYGPLVPISDKAYDLALAPFRKIFSCPLEEGRAFQLPSASILLEWCIEPEVAPADERSQLVAIYMRNICEGLIRGIVDGAQAYEEDARSSAQNAATLGIAYCLPEPAVAISALADALVADMQTQNPDLLDRESPVVTVREHLRENYPCP